MRLQALHDGSVYATDGRSVLSGDSSRQLATVGQLPLPPEGWDRFVYRALTSVRLRPVTDALVGAVSTVNVWPLTAADLLGTVGRQLVVSSDGGRNWEPSRRLPDSSGPMGVLPSAVTHRDGVTYLGEYPLDSDVTPRILASEDYGRSWSKLRSLPDVRHVHAIQQDSYTGDLWVTTGDTDSESRIGRLRDGTFEVVGGGSQRWRAVELAFTPSAILWGMDCVYADTNWIFKLPRDELGGQDPTPEPVHQVPSSVYYSTSLDVDGDRWVVFSTAMEAGRDSTGPETQRAPADSRGVVVAASSASGYRDWYELASFHRRRTLADRLPIDLPAANGYVFLAADPDHGLVINPFNTARDAGTIRSIPTAQFASANRPRPAE